MKTKQNDMLWNAVPSELACKAQGGRGGGGVQDFGKRGGEVRVTVT